MRSTLIALIVTYGLADFGNLAWSEESKTINHGMLQKPVLDLNTALKLVDAARAYAASHGWPCAISVVDDGGWTLAQVRMDGAPVVAGVDLAHGKARTAALFKRPSDDLEKAINGGRMAVVTAGLVMLKGGRPVMETGHVVGALGISADTPAHDDEIALAALAATGHDR